MLKNGKIFLQIAQGSMKLHFTFVIVFFFAEEERAIWCQIFARIFHPMILHVNDVSVILDRKHNRDSERTIEIYRLCNFPHIRLR